MLTLTCKADSLSLPPLFGRALIRVIFMHLGQGYELGPPDAPFAQLQTPELKQFLSSIH